MKKRNKLFAVLLVLALSMSLTIPAFAEDASSVTSVTEDCSGVRFVGFANSADTVTLEVRLHDTSNWQSPRIQDDIIAVGPGAFDVFVPWVDNPDGRLGRGYVDINGTNVQDPSFEGIIYCPPPPGDEGCTPGYWKNHLEDWLPTGLNPTDDFDTTFGVNLFDPDITLEQAVNAKGGGVKKLARHGTAALLSAAHPEVASPLSVAQVIAFVQTGDVDPLVAANELGCEIP